MEEGNLAILVDAKTEYTKQLVNILKGSIYQGIKKLYTESKDSCNELNEPEKCLLQFQRNLSEIPKWNQEIINTECSRIIDESKCDWLEELITAVFVSHTRILTSINFSKNKKKINLKIPKADHFIHQCYIDIARIFWKSPYLLDDTISKYDYQRNRRDAEFIIEGSIGETIRKQLPVKHILKEYLGNEYEETEINTETNELNTNEILDEKYKDNLRKMVQTEIENCSKGYFNVNTVNTPPPSPTTIKEHNATDGNHIDEYNSVNTSTQVNTPIPAENSSNTMPINTENSVENNVNENNTSINASIESSASSTDVTNDTNVANDTNVSNDTNVTTTEEPLIENLTMEMSEPEMKIETLNLDDIEDLNDLQEVYIDEPNKPIVQLEDLNTLDNELQNGSLNNNSEVNLSINNANNNSSDKPSNNSSEIKTIVLDTDINEDEKLKKQILKNYIRKRDYSFFNDAVDSDNSD